MICPKCFSTKITHLGPEGDIGGQVWQTYRCEKCGEKLDDTQLLKKVSWFSAGVSSAVATKLSNPDEIIYVHIDDQHPDTMRFVMDCEKWFGKKITILQSPLKNVGMACRKSGVLSLRGMSPCTKWLKKQVRKEWESTQIQRLTYVWGFDCGEKMRMDRIVESDKEHQHEFPLKDITKAEAHQILETAGIKRPQMYELGYPNNNCIGCIRGGKGYWNKIKKDFPLVFKQRMGMEELFGHSIIKGCFLKDLKDNEGRCEKIELDECGIMCQLYSPRPTTGAEGKEGA